jgi:hypothetical protein
MSNPIYDGRWISGPVASADPVPAIPADATVAEAAASDVSVAVVQATPAPVQQYPVGKIDFNKPFLVNDGYDNRYDGRVVAVLKNSSYPVVVCFDNDGETVMQFDTDGDSDDGDYTIEQAREYPYTVYGAMLEEDGDLKFVETVFSSETDLRNQLLAYQLDDLVAVFPVTVTGPAVSHKPASEQEESEADADDNVPIGSPIDEFVLRGRSIKVGDTVWTSRRGFGHRQCKVLKMRKHPHVSLFVDPQDGNNPYWALNKNIS